MWGTRHLPSDLDCPLVFIQSRQRPSFRLLQFSSSCCNSFFRSMCFNAQQPQNLCLHSLISSLFPSLPTSYIASRHHATMAPRKRARSAAQVNAPCKGGRPHVKASPTLSNARLAVAPLLQTPRLLSNSPALLTPPVLPPIRPALLKDLSLAERLPPVRPA